MHDLFNTSHSEVYPSKIIWRALDKKCIFCFIVYLALYTSLNIGYKKICLKFIFGEMGPFLSMILENIASFKTRNARFYSRT